MRNEIEKYIDKNRSQLDVDAPSDALWGKIEEELDDNKKRRGRYFTWLVAASIISVCSVFIFKYEKYPMVEIADEENLNTQQPDSIYILERRLGDNLKFTGYSKIKQYSFFWDWVLSYNLNDWQSRARIWTIYKLKREN